MVRKRGRPPTHACHLNQVPFKLHVLEALKDFLGCACCGRTSPVRLVYHHLNPWTKFFCLGSRTALRLASWESIWTEVDKCEVLCKGCHYRNHLFKNEISQPFGYVQTSYDSDLL